MREIRGRMPVTRVPHAAPQLAGVIHLRGAIAPLLDLRLRPGLPVATRDTEATVIVVQLTAEVGADRPAGLVVEQNSDVLAVNDQHAATTADSAQAPTGHAEGLVRDAGNTVVLPLLSSSLDFRGP